MKTYKPGQLTPRVATLYQHTQTTAATTWVIEHRLYDFPIIDVYTDIAGTLTKIVPASISHVSDTVANVTFQEARSGVALVI